MGNRRLLLNMYPNWLQSLVRIVLTGKYWQKMGSKISGALIGRIASGLRRMYHQKRKEVKEHNERIENRSKNTESFTESDMPIHSKGKIG